jgi:hypothetical protein
MFLEDNKSWYGKYLEYEKAAAKLALDNSDAIFVARALSWRSPEKEKEKKTGQVVEEIIFDGPNPDAGDVATIHEVKILEVIKGTYKVGEVIDIVVMEPARYSMGKRCSEPSYEMVANVEPFDNTFKYLFYTKQKIVLRHNMFIEWPEHLTAEQEYRQLKN